MMRVEKDHDVGVVFFQILRWRRRQSRLTNDELDVTHRIVCVLWY